MRRPTPLSLASTLAAVLAAASLVLALFVAAHASVVETLTAPVHVSAAPVPPGVDAGRVARAEAATAAVEDTSLDTARDHVARIERDATWLALANGLLVVVLAVAGVLSRRR